MRYRYKVLVTASYLRPVIKNYREIFGSHYIKTIVPEVKERLSEDGLLKYIKDVDGIICGDDKLTARVLAQASRLKIISKWGTGTDSIDKEAAKQLGIPVKNTPNAFTEPVADTVLNYILCLARNTIDLNEKMHKNIWKKQTGLALHECTLGVVGAGNIGTAVIKRAQAFGMQLLSNDTKKKSFNFMVSLEKLLRESDFVSFNCDLNPTSFHLLNKERLAFMKPTAYVINTSRGPVIEEKALIEALEQKKIAGAGLDVFEEEPLPADSSLRKMPNVILSPHNANASKVAWEYIHKTTINNVIEELTKHKR